MHEPILAKILRWFVYASAFVPLIIFNEYISPFHFGKVVILRSLVELMLVFYILLIWKDRAYLPRINKIGWSFLFFALAFSITTMTSVIPYASMWGSLERMGGLFSFWHYFIYFVIITAVFRKESDWISLFKVMIVIGVLSAFYGFLQRTSLEWVVGSGGRERIFGTIGNAALFAGYQIVCSFVALTLFFRPNNSFNYKLFYGASFAIMAFAALMTAVRGSVLGVGVGLLTFALLYSSAYRSKKGKKVLLGLIGMLFLFVIFALLFKDTSFVKNSRYLRRITDFSFQSYTVQTRFWAWEAGIKGWKESPKTILLGWGPENFNIPFSRYFNPKFYQGPGSETLFDRAHNMFVEILVTMGLLGFLSYLGIFAMSFKALWKKLHNKETMIYGVGLIPLLIAYAIHNSFIFDTSANFLVFFTVLGFISFLSSPGIENKKPDFKPKKVNEGLFLFVAIILFVFAAAAIYFINVLPARANYTTTRAIVLGWSDNFPAAVAKYKEAVSYDVPGKYEIRNRFAQYVLEKMSSHTVTPEEAEVVKFVIGEMQKNIDENPQDYLPLLYTSRLFINLGKADPASEYNEKALEMSLRALEISPTFVRTYYEIGQVYLNKKEFDKAAEYFRKSAELNPEVGLSFWYWGVVEVEGGNVSVGLEILENAIKNAGYTPNESDVGRLAGIYLKRNDYSGVAWAYELLIASNPANPQYRASLAVAYANIGRYDDAVRQAKEAARLNPEFETEARAFVQSLGKSW